MYFYYLYGYKIKQNKIDRRFSPYFLALDGDIDFHPDALITTLEKLIAAPKVAVCCGRIHPTGSYLSPMLYYQKFEYAIGHWLQKASEHIFGCVLCSPGCFSLIRAKALEYDTNGKKDSVIPIYKQRPSDDNPMDIIQWNQGEDRWLCTLMMKRGWRIEFVAVSHSYTNAPMELKEFFNQRRRWGPSSLFNVFDVVYDFKTVININDSINMGFIFYTAILNVSGLLSTGTIILERISKYSCI